MSTTPLSWLHTFIIIIIITILVPVIIIVFFHSLEIGRQDVDHFRIRGLPRVLKDHFGVFRRRGKSRCIVEVVGCCSRISTCG